MTTLTAEKTFTDDQLEAIERVGQFIESERRGSFRVGGLAGTGKSTVLSHILDVHTGGMPCAFTGKAAHVLRCKGVRHAKTIHSTIYTWKEDLQRFVLREELPGRYFAIDEGSMISRRLWEDVQSFGIPIVLFGDYGQLEPVGDDVYLMQDCDLLLKQIHRQAEGNPIIQFAYVVRNNQPFRHGTKDTVTIAPKSEFWDAIGKYEHLLCGFNRTRAKANRIARERLGFSRPIEVGERLIVLQNDSFIGVFNGMMLTVEKVKPDGGGFWIEAVDDNDDFKVFYATTEWLGSEKAPSQRERLSARGQCAIVDYGYCTSVHKFQGSEADSVAVLDEQCKLWSPDRWRYTAVTRAAERLLFAIA